MKKIAISLLISIIMLFSVMNYSYGSEYAFTPPYFQSSDSKLLIYNTINAARIKLANGQIATNVEVTGKSEIEVETVYEDADVLLIIDTSGSMGLGERMESAKNAGKNLVNQLMNITNMKMGLVEFNDEARVISSFTNNKEILEGDINSLNALGGTYLKRALDKIGNGINFDDSVKLENRVIVTLTDGATMDANEAAKKYAEYKSQGYKLYHVLLGFENTEAFMYEG